MTPAVAPAQHAPIVFASQVEARERVVTLGALADVSVLPVDIRAPAAALRILKIPEDRDQIQVNEAQLRGRVAALAPALKPWLEGADNQVLIRYQRNIPVALRSRACVKMLEAVVANATPTPRSFSPAPCNGEVRKALWFDAHDKVMRARRALRVGEVLAAPATSALAGVSSGDPLVIEAKVGPVRVQRRLLALQPARPGENLFARTADGSVIAIPYPSADQ